VRLVDRIRESIEGGYFDEYKAEVLGRFYGSKPSSTGA
jgi:queuine tRNA-ribosyltransferase